MYYVTLGNNGYIDTSGNYAPSFGLSDAGPFGNFQSGSYWSGVEYALYTDVAWFFYTDYGSQYAFLKSNVFSAWAVHPGDVAAVPEPQSYLLALTGLAVAMVAARRRQA